MTAAASSPPSLLVRWGPRGAAGAFTALGALHVLWATGSSWPAQDAGAISGRSASASPGPVACLAVAGLLGTAAALVTGHPRRRPPIARAGSAGVAATFALRGVLGVAGRTDLVSPGSTSARFRALDRRFYGPLCLGLAALSAPAALPGPQPAAVSEH
jgi:Protein of unknown function (DUF3995)